MHAILSEPVFSSDVTLTVNYTLVHPARRNGRHFSGTPPTQQHFILYKEYSRAGAFYRLNQPDIVISDIRGCILPRFAACRSPDVFAARPTGALDDPDYSRFHPDYVYHCLAELKRRRISKSLLRRRYACLRDLGRIQIRPSTVRLRNETPGTGRS